MIINRINLAILEDNLSNLGDLTKIWIIYIKNTYMNDI